MSSNSEQSLVQELFANLQKRIVDVIDRIAPELVEKARDRDGKSLFDIGVKYYDKKMYTKAMAWFQLSAEHNYADAQIKIGTMYQNGFGVTVDYQRAIKWHVKAASLGYSVAFSHIGFIFEKGLGVPIDKQKALELYYKFKRYTSGLTRLEHQGYSLNENQKVKSSEDLLSEVKRAVRKEIDLEFSSNIDEWKQIKKNMGDEVKLSKKSNRTIEQALKGTNERIKNLEDASKEAQHKQGSMITRLQKLNQELATSLDLEIKQRKDDIRLLKQGNDQVIRELKKENSDIKQRLGILERIIQNLDPEALNNAKIGCNDNNDFYYDSA